MVSGEVFGNLQVPVENSPFTNDTPVLLMDTGEREAVSFTLLVAHAFPDFLLQLGRQSEQSATGDTFDT